MTARAAKKTNTHGRRACAVEVSPREVDAGAAFTIAVRASCRHGCDLTGHAVSIRDDKGATLAVTALAATADDAYACTVTLPAPLDVGEHTWRAVLAALEKDALSHEETATAFIFSTKAHAASVNVWSVPSALAPGEPFGFKVGVKCSAGCKLAGRHIAVFDRDGAQVTAGYLCDDPWPDTSALYFVELQAKAPPERGDYLWRVETPGSLSGVPHAAGSSTFAIRTVGAAEHEVAVEALDAGTGAPIKGIHVLLHPYRAFTDDRGMAKVRVAPGSYRLHVSGFNYVAHESILEVANDVAIRAALSIEPEGQEDYR